MAFMGDDDYLCTTHQYTIFAPTLYTDMTIGEIMPLKNKLSNNRQLFCRNKDCADTLHRHYQFLPANSTCFSLSNGWLFVVHGSSHIIRHQASSSPLSGLAPRSVFAIYNPFVLRIAATMQLCQPLPCRRVGICMVFENLPMAAMLTTLNIHLLDGGNAPQLVLKPLPSTRSSPWLLDLTLRHCCLPFSGGFCI